MFKKIRNNLKFFIVIIFVMVFIMFLWLIKFEGIFEEYDLMLWPTFYAIKVIFGFATENYLGLEFSALFCGLTILLLSKFISNERIIWIVSFWNFIAIISLFHYASKVFWNQEIVFIKIYDFIHINDFNITFDFVYDQITLVMVFVVMFITYMVINFSYWYMLGDPNYLKFVAFINFFSFFMLILVTANNLILIFVGWEGIGIFSYLLINFWSTRLNANRSALKALVVNKIGDCFFYIYIFLYFFIFESFNLYDVKLLVTSYSYDSSVLFFDETIYLLVFFLIIACMAKSAQIMLHVWLPDAMEGPTPVSALLHAATMVTAGIYVLIKFNWLIFFNESVYSFIILIGITTNLLASLSAIYQYDIKKVIAYSTASQLGLIFIAFGTLKFNLALFHIFNHSFFKALLFILAGILIHYLNNKQDLRVMSFFKNSLFYFYIIFLVASLSLAGFPFLSGFYSKDLIIQYSFINLIINKSLVIFFLKLSLITTILYSFRVVHFLFLTVDAQMFKNFKKKIKYSIIYDIKFIVFVVIYILVGFSIYIGFFTSTFFLNDFLVLSSNLTSNLYSEKLHVSLYLEYSCVIFFFCIILAVFVFMIENFFVKHWLFFSNCLKAFFFLNKKTLFDNLYYYISKVFLTKLEIAIVSFDKIVIERFIIFFVNNGNNFIKKIKNIHANFTWHIYVMLIISILIDVFTYFVAPDVLYVGILCIIVYIFYKIITTIANAIINWLIKKWRN